MPTVKKYRWDLAIQYANRWALGRNPAYYDFTTLGCDCTNFISQCLYAGRNTMNPDRTLGWYYYSINRRSPSWTGVEFLYNFLTTNQKKGVFAREVDVSKVHLGDLIQLADGTGDYYHTLIITMMDQIPNMNTIYVNAHDFNAKLRPLNTYQYESLRFLHIEGVYV